MILENHIRGRRRILNDAKKARLCELVAHESYSVEQAAESLDVSLRTVQRERKFDQDFDHEVRLALQQPPEPLKLMEHAARTHWRAAAWLLERSNPEEYARKPVNTANAKQVWAALQFVTEAALRAVAPEQRQAAYGELAAACKAAHDCCFPAFGPWGDPRRPKLPPTPLYDATSREAIRLECGLPAPTPEELAAQARHAAEREPWKQRLAEKRRAEAVNQPWLADEEGILSPTIAKTTECPTTASAAPSLDELAATPGETLSPAAASDMLSPKTEETTKCDVATECDAATRLQRLERDAADLAWMVRAHCPESLHANDDFAHPDVDADPRVRIQLYQERLDRHKRRERQQARAAAKKVKAAKKRAAAQRRRAA
jgi:hypothetical protein